MSGPGKFKNCSRFCSATFAEMFLDFSDFLRKKSGFFRKCSWNLLEMFLVLANMCSVTCSGNVPGNFQKISRKIPGNFREMSMKFPGNFQDISRKCPGNVQEISRKIPAIFYEHSRTISGKCPGICPENIQEISRKFPELS